MKERTRPHVVIVGGGFAGLEAAKALSRADADILVLDRHNHHCFQPLLYQVATAALSPADIAWPIRSILSRQQNARVLLAEVTGIDLARGEVFTDAMPPLHFDYLVLATGATHSYFGHDEWAPLAPGLKHLEDATDIRRRLLIAFEKAEIETDPDARRRLMTFVIVGGGPTGVELAGALAEVACCVLARDFRSIDPRSSRIILLEGGPRILPAFPEDLSQYAQRSLERMGVTVRTSTMVTDCRGEGVVTASGERISASTILWAAGVKASPAAAWTQAPCDRAGRIKVNPDLSLPGYPNVFAVGDTAHVDVGDGRPVPGIAPAAKQMGRHVGRLIARRIAGEAGAQRFSYRHYGDLATIGRKSAVVSIGRLRLKGVLAWLFWSIAHIYFLIGVRNRFSVAVDWLWEYLTLQRGARLISDPPAPLPARAFCKTSDRPRLRREETREDMGKS
jgi:NADH dehydrogenase